MVKRHKIAFATICCIVLFAGVASAYVDATPAHYRNAAVCGQLPGSGGLLQKTTLNGKCITYYSPLTNQAFCDNSSCILQNPPPGSNPTGHCQLDPFGQTCVCMVLALPLLPTVAAGSMPYSVAVNQVTNKIYVANYGSNTVTVIDGATNAPITVNVGGAPSSVAVNPVTNKIYVANYNSNTVTVIDGATNSTTPVNAGSGSISVAVNPLTNK